MRSPGGYASSLTGVCRILNYIKISPQKGTKGFLGVTEGGQIQLGGMQRRSILIWGYASNKRLRTLPKIISIERQIYEHLYPVKLKKRDINTFCQGKKTPFYKLFEYSNLIFEHLGTTSPPLHKKYIIIFFFVLQSSLH